MRLLITVFGCVLVLFSFNTYLGSQCPEDPIDSGICDTLYAEPWPADIADSVWSRPGPYFVRVPIYVTHDLPDPDLDSLDAFVVPLCYTHSNPSKYCSVGAYWNNVTLSGPTVSRSVFRHFIQGSDTLVHNRMMDLFQQGGGRDWDSRIANLDGTSHFWFVVIASSAPDQNWWEGSRVLLATMTFKLEDTMRISMDSCFWPPGNHLAFERYGDITTYCPRDNLPISFRAALDSILFAPADSYVTGLTPLSVSCADLDGDTDLDLAVANYTSGNVSILKNNGNGTFASAVNYGAGLNPYSVFCADLDGDADLDLTVADFGSSNVSILKNNGNGTFASAVNYGTGSGPVSVFCADLDDDADLDLAVANFGNNVSILKNYGNGTFASAVNYGAGSYPLFVFCADLDDDADLDLAVANRGDAMANRGGNVSILKNYGNGTFASAVNYGAGSGPGSVFCADLDDDADLDLAIANLFSDSVSILKNNGDGTFASAVNHGAGDAPISVFCADLDGDTDLDLAVTNEISSNVSILKNNGDGTFASAVNYGAGSYPMSVFCGDLDGDGDLDLAVANQGSHNVSVLKNITQLPANQPPWAFSLLSPENGATTPDSATFRWRIPYDPNFGDQFRYDLYLSTTPGFESPTIISNLPVSTYGIALVDSDYYWKVKAKDNWGAERWSTETWMVQFHYLTDGLTIIAYSPVDLIVTDPIGDSISLWFNTIPNASYDTTQDYDLDGDKDDIVTIPHRLVGDYIIEVVAEPGGSGTYDLGIRIDGGAPAMLTMPGGAPCPGSGVVDTFNYSAPWYKTGDANGDWNLDIGDVVYIINYLFKGGVSPDPLGSGDSNCDSLIDIGDVVYLINYLFKSGPPPSC